MGERQTSIIAIVTTQEQVIKSSAAPIFVAKTKEEMQKVSSSLEGILDASAHEIDQDTMIIVAR